MPNLYSLSINVIHCCCHVKCDVKNLKESIRLALAPEHMKVEMEGDETAAIEPTT